MANIFTARGSCAVDEYSGRIVSTTPKPGASTLAASWPKLVTLYVSPTRVSIFLQAGSQAGSPRSGTQAFRRHLPQAFASYRCGKPWIDPARLPSPSKFVCGRTKDGNRFRRPVVCRSQKASQPSYAVQCRAYSSVCVCEGGVTPRNHS